MWIGATRDADIGAARVAFVIFREVRAHDGPGGPHARAHLGGSVTWSLAIRRRFKAATTYWPAA